jgi:hypothetical protein
MPVKDAEPIVPSYIGKVRRAEKHIIELKAAISKWAGVSSDTRPYTVRPRPQGKHQGRVRWELHFTAGVANTDVPLIAADVIYNLRSSLDHLIAACVKSADRKSVMFPIFWKGVWEPAIPGENSERTKARNRWASIAGKVPTDAVAVLKSLQPPDDAGDAQQGDVLRILNELSNNDRHTKLPLIANGLEGILIVWQLPDGKIMRGWSPPDANGATFVENGAEIQGVPNGAVHMESYGAPEIVVRRAVRSKQIPNDISLVSFLDQAVGVIKGRVTPSLMPHLWQKQRG